MLALNVSAWKQLQGMLDSGTSNAIILHFLDLLPLDYLDAQALAVPGLPSAQHPVQQNRLP